MIKVFFFVRKGDFSSFFFEGVRPLLLELAPSHELAETLTSHPEKKPNYLAIKYDVLGRNCSQISLIYTIVFFFFGNERDILDCFLDDCLTKVGLKLNSI